MLAVAAQVEPDERIGFLAALLNVRLKCFYDSDKLIPPSMRYKHSWLAYQMAFTKRFLQVVEAALSFQCSWENNLRAHIGGGHSSKVRRVLCDKLPQNG